MSDYTQGNSFYESDSFESDTEHRNTEMERKNVSSQPLSTKNTQMYKDYKQISNAAKNRQRNNNKKFIQQKRVAVSQLEVTAQRILSARKHKITDQNNFIQELQKQIETLQLENKTLKSQTYRQEKALSKIDSKQSDLPRILEQHQSEMLSVKEQLRRTKEMLNNEIKIRKDCDIEVLKLRTALSKANQLVSDKNLGERSSLQMQLVEAHEKLESSEKSLETTTRYLENIEKSHKRELSNLKRLIKQLENSCRDLEKEVDQLKISLKEKEKLLEIQNIYSHRFKVPHRIPGSGERHTCAVCLETNNDQLLDKLNFKGLQERQSNSNQMNYQPNQIDESTKSNYLDPEKIKEDIRKILEEEILSGRIKPMEYQSHDRSNPISKDTSKEQSPERVVSVQESINTGRTIASDVFDKEPQTQIESIKEEIKEVPKESDEQIEQNLKQKQTLLEKLNMIDKIEVPEITEEKKDLKYSYPNDTDYVKNDVSSSDIETISAVDMKKPTKTYKFNETVENLHQGLPVTHHNSDLKRHSSESKRGSLASKNDLINFQIDASKNQKNNSYVEQSRDESLPPLTEAERQNKERELMSELFGQTPANVTYKHRTTNLPWDNNDSLRPRSNKSPPNLYSRDLGKSEDLEEIML